ncbi:putative ABC exporter domain-containing protein [Clostridium sp. C8-1-8]|uniref:putative ABC exporter domain-containing protein n=1 Tax=Clostridium sp. C8-1-8 TaxID=2698831 RepID=UPI00136CD33C|nr:putative ABC exporter domain-containing protein [Clostridium sp. C8-1-8]
MKDSSIRDLITLAYMETVQYKNNFIEALKHPYTAMKTIGSFLFPFIILLLIYTRKGGGAANILKAMIKPNLLAAIAMAILLLLLILTIKNSVTKYDPSQFTSADVNYLFPSPISPKTIYGFTIIRKCIKGLVSSVLLIVVMAMAISKVSDIHISKLIYVIIAVLIFPLLRNALIFLTYTLSNRFNLGKLIKYCVYGFTGVIIVCLLYSVAGSKNILDTLVNTLNGRFFSDIPIAGWLRDLLIAPFIPNKAPIMQAIGLVIVTAAMLLCAIYFADEYYEEAGESVNYHEKIENTPSTNIYDIVDSLEDTKKNKPVEVFNTKELTGPWAFIWKSSIINKRTAKKGSVFGYVIALIASVALCYVLRTKEFNSFYPIFILIFLQGAVTSAQISSPLKYELKKQYLFLLPGSAAEKLLALHTKQIVNSVKTDTLMLLPLMLFTKTSVLQVLLLWLIAVASIVICYFSVVITVLITPPNDNGKNSMISALVAYIMVAPAAATAAIIAIYLKNVMLSLLMFAIISIVIIMIIIFLSDYLFSKIELR